MLLNPDARLLDDRVLRAVEFMGGNANIAVGGPMTLDGDGQLHDTFRTFMSLWIFATRTFSITNKLMWIHLISFCKYYFKWLRLRWSL